MPELYLKEATVIYGFYLLAARLLEVTSKLERLDCFHLLQCYAPYRCHTGKFLTTFWHLFDNFHIRWPIRMRRWMGGVIGFYRRQFTCYFQFFEICLPIFSLKSWVDWEWTNNGILVSFLFDIFQSFTCIVKINCHVRSRALAKRLTMFDVFLFLCCLTFKWFNLSLKLVDLHFVLRVFIFYFTRINIWTRRTAACCLRMASCMTIIEHASSKTWECHVLVLLLIKFLQCSLQ